MFENTLKNLKKTLFSIQIAFYLIIIIHLCYCTIVFGDLLPNLPLLLITVAYLAFLIVISEKNGKATRLAKKSTKKAYRWAKILIKGVTLFITVNAFSSLGQSPNIFSVITTFLMAIGWIASVLIEIIASSIENRVKKIKNNLGNLFKKNKEPNKEDTSVHK